MKLIRKGAEGDIFLTTWINQKAILKSRKKKDYRNESLDYRLRKQRTIRESEIMSEVKKIWNSHSTDLFCRCSKL